MTWRAVATGALVLALGLVATACPGDPAGKGERGTRRGVEVENSRADPIELYDRDAGGSLLATVAARSIQFVDLPMKDDCFIVGLVARDRAGNVVGRYPSGRCPPAGDDRIDRWTVGA